MSENPTLAELGIDRRPASALSTAGLKTRADLEQFGLDRLEEIHGIGDDYAAEIRAKVSQSYQGETSGPSAGIEATATESGPEALTQTPAQSQQPIQQDRLERATLFALAGMLANPKTQFHHEAEIVRYARKIARLAVASMD